jgi:hypothetical protein
MDKKKDKASPLRVGKIISKAEWLQLPGRVLVFFTGFLNGFLQRGKGESR